MSQFVLQGIATETGKCFHGKGGNVIFLEHRCFDASMNSKSEIRLLLDHDKASCLAKTTNESLEVYAGATGLAFRFHIPDSCSYVFRNHVDDLDTYVPISIGFDDGSADLIAIDGIKVTSVTAARLYEISILSKAPAIHSTYGRLVSAETCGTLENDYESGRLSLIGRYIAMHRAFKASENGGILRFSHASSSYDRAAAGFEKALEKLR